MMTCAAAQAGPYVLRPGDALRVTVSGMPELDATAAIDNDGYLRLPQFEPIPIAGRTVAAAMAEMRDAVDGRLFKRFDAAGSPTFVSLAADDLHLSVAAYRAVSVLGAVGAPRALPFQPGMTVRAALAASGGVSAVGQQLRGGVVDAAAAARLQADYGSLTLERARLRAESWRIMVQLGRADPAVPPTEEELGVTAAVAESLVSAQRDQMATADSLRAKREAYLQSAIAQTSARIDILREQVDRQSEGLAGDEEELEKIKGLHARGVVPNDRLLDIRRAQTLSATRLLETQSDLERVRLDQERFKADLATIDDDLAAKLKTDLQTAASRLAEITLRLDAARAQLGMAGVAPAEVGLDAPRAKVVVHRGVGADAVALEPGLDDLLEPGDVVEVELIVEEPTQP
jgi:polysaccharide export outer membrane protein